LPDKYVRRDFVFIGVGVIRLPFHRVVVVVAGVVRILPLRIRLDPRGHTECHGRQRVKDGEAETMDDGEC
jgi:hypothetical protein